MMSTSVSDSNAPGAITASAIRPAMPPSEAPISAGGASSAAATSIRSSPIESA